MSEEKINQLVASAVGGEFQQWAIKHPSLAAVIDRIRLTEQAVESLRKSDEYRQAIAAYHRDQNELSLLGQLAELAGGILHDILGI